MNIILLSKKLRILWLLMVCGLMACDSSQTNRKQGVYMLLDTSGTYTTELKKAQQVIGAILAKLQAGDSFAVARIDTGSFSEKDIIAKVTFDSRPSMANKQKRLFKQSIDRFVKQVRPAAYTDITGGLLQASEFLKEKNNGKNTIIIYSDLKQDLKAGYNRKVPLELLDFRVVALNVTKLRSDNIDPNEYIGRLKSWKKKVESSDGQWAVINDLERLENILP